MSERILLVQLADIGDMVLTTPAMAALRQSRPDAFIVLLTSPHAAAIIDPALVDEVITFNKDRFTPKGLLNPFNWSRIRWLLYDLRKKQFDTIVFFHHFTLKLGTLKFALISYVLNTPRRIGLENGNGYFLTERVPDQGFGAFHQSEYWLQLVERLGADPTPRRARIGTGEDVLPIPAHGKQTGKGIRVIIHPGSGSYSLARRWDTQKFARVADMLCNDYDAQVVLVGTYEDSTGEVVEAMQHPAIDLAGQTSLTQVADLLRSADLFIGAESGVMHIAAAVGTPMVAIFGPGNPDAWGPWSPGGQVRIIRSAVECSPCSYVEHSIGLRNGCAARTCLKLITPEEVYQACHELLNDKPAPELLPVPASTYSHNRITILGLPVDAVTYEQWMEITVDWVANGERCHHVCTTNPEFKMIARSDPNFRNILKRADLSLPDGVGLLWAAKRQGNPIPERVTGSDGVWVIAEHAAHYGWKLFFLGAAPGVADTAADILREYYPELQIVGTYSGSPSPDEEDELVEMVNSSSADILLVAYGAPVQDKWIARNLPRLQAKMAMGVGGSFDFIAGIIPRAPERMQQLGLEWLYRLYKQPWRIWRMMRLPRFVLAVLFEKNQR